MESINLQFMVEKSIGKGEDSEPILSTTESSAITGVFDGMGGSGASLCDSEYGKGHTKAYVASRIIREAIDKHINCKDTKVDERILKEICVTRLNSEIQKFPTEKSLLRSKIVREYPTTFTLIVAKEDDRQTIIDSYWAGDSRNYLWTKDGFYQISKDDLENGNDPLDNLSNDSALSNCVCADKDFTIHHKEIIIGKQPYVIISATDGCFGYLKTPMHFEQLLASSLFFSKTLDEWEKKLKDTLQKISGDDFSLSLVARRFTDFNELSKEFGKKSNKLAGAIDSLQNQIENLQNKLIEAEDELKEAISTNWEEYKPSYLKYLEYTSYTDQSNKTNQIEGSGKTHEIKFRFRLKLPRIRLPHSKKGSSYNKSNKGQKCKKAK